MHFMFVWLFLNMSKYVLFFAAEHLLAHSMGTTAPVYIVSIPVASWASWELVKTRDSLAAGAHVQQTHHLMCIRDKRGTVVCWHHKQNPMTIFTYMWIKNKVTIKVHIISKTVSNNTIFWTELFFPLQTVGWYFLYHQWITWELFPCADVGSVNKYHNRRETPPHSPCPSCLV